MTTQDTRAAFEAQIGLPPLPARWEPKLKGFVEYYTRATVEADRQRRGGPMAWCPVETAPTDGTAILVLIPDSDIPKVVRWRNGCWEMTWDGHPLSEYDQPRYWMPCPSDPDALDAPQPAEPVKGPSDDDIIAAVKVYGMARANGITTASELELRLHDIRTLLARYANATEPATPVSESVDGLAHEIWSAAQLAPGEGIEDGVTRVEALLAGRPVQPDNCDAVNIAVFGE